MESWEKELSGYAAKLNEVLRSIPARQLLQVVAKLDDTTLQALWRACRSEANVRQQRAEIAAESWRIK